MSVIYLIRHGQASFGTDNYDQLSAVGREQSAILGSYFADLREPIHGIYTGTLERQRETAQLVAAALAPNPPPLMLDAAFHGRIIAAIDKIMRTEGRGRTLVVSTSGGVIGTIVAHVLGLANHIGIELNWAVHNASITRLIYNADKMSLSMFNGLPHLDQEGRRQLITYR